MEGEKNTNLIINKPLSIASAMGRGLGWGKGGLRLNP